MKATIFVLSILLFTVGCAHTHDVVGAEPKSEIPEGIRVGIGEREVKEGDKVGVFRSVCKNTIRHRGIDANKCTSQKVGEALVLKILDHDSAIVRPEGGIVMDNKMYVEKL